MIKMTFHRGLCLLSLLLPMQALAENWVTIGLTGEVTHLINMDAVIPDPRGKKVVHVQWKTRSPTKEVLFQGLVSCEDWELTQHLGSEIDLRSGQDEILPESKLRTLYPNYPGLTTAPEVKFVCDRMKPDVIAKMTALPGEGCALPTSDPVKELCSHGSEFRANNYLFWRRTGITRQSCGESQEDFLTATREVYTQRYFCKDQKCRDEVIDKSMHLIAMDIEASDRWADQKNSLPLPPGTCKFVPALKKKAKERETGAKFFDAMEKFQKCLLKKVGRLDDRQSGAEIIARALQNACKSELITGLEIDGIKTQTAQDEWQKRFEPKVIEIILENRATRRNKK